MTVLIKLRLSLLMFLQYFIWGTWYVTMGTYMIVTLKADAVQVGSAYATFSIAAMISPFFVGLIADRYFSSQKVLSVLHLLGAFVLYYISTVSDVSGFWWLILLYTLLYTPTIALSNSVSFNQMKDPGKEFPAVRVLGTLGWIVAGVLISRMDLESSAGTFRLAAASSIVLSLFSLFLPGNSPVKTKVSFSSIIGLDALVLFKKKSFVLFLVTSVLICIPLAFYYNFANPFLNDIGMKNAAGKMTLGQGSEVFFMLLIPFLFSRLGVKKMFLIAVACWVIRYVFFAYGDTGQNNWMLLGGILLHGICYDFFFVTGQIYTEKSAGESVKNSAQGLITFATYGIGMLIGSYLSGILTQQYALSGQSLGRYDWKIVWLIPAGTAAVVLVLFALFFKEEPADKN